MKIDRDTKYDDFIALEPYMAEGEAERLQGEAVKSLYGEDGFYNMTLGDMFAVLSGDPSPLCRGVEPQSVFAVYRTRAFAEFVNGFIENMKRLTLPPTAEQVKHAQGCLPSQFDESVYVFCRNYFGLRGFAEVEALKVADLLLAKKDSYNHAVVERNIAASMRKGARA